jgi:regulator of sigma E protease
MLDVLWSIGAFIVAIGILVTFHEFGHFWVARRCGVKVLRFSVGFGKPIWSRTGRDGTEYVIAAIPLGGYVKMLDEREGDVPEAMLQQSFNRKPLHQRMAIVAAGPAFNFALAAVFYWMTFVVGISDMKPVLGEPAPGTPVAEAGLRGGETVTSVNGQNIPTWTHLRTTLIDQALAGGALTVVVAEPQGGQRTVRVETDQVRVDPEFLFADLGMQPYTPVIPPRLAEVIEGEAAALAGLRAGDLLLERDGVAIESWQDWATWLRANPDTATTLSFERDGTVVTREIRLGSALENGESVGRFGARVEVSGELWQDLRVVHRLSPLSAIGSAVIQTYDMSWLTVRMLYRMVVGDVSVKNVSGPIQIAQYAGFTASAGIITFLSFLAIISVSLGVLNLLPVPMLDGGHLLYYMIEAVKGSPVSDRTQIVGQQLGLVMLAGLMGLAFYNDLTRLFG